MKNVLIAIGLLVLMAGCGSNKQKTTIKADTVSKKAAGIQYTCTMHADVIADKPGTCPKCGMELVEKDDTKK